MEIKNKVIKVVMMMLFVVSVAFLARETAQFVMGNGVKERQRCVVIDAGHGGTDPGKVGINGALEKDINLQIAKRLKKILTAQDIKVVMTRDNQNGLSDSNAINKKVQDMKNRITIIEKEKPDLVVSIHQNSYHEENVFGAQVFYYANSESGNQLADTIQTQIVESTRQKKKRVAKANSSYYLLKKTSVPIVIVECGFLSNREEAEMLVTQEYQDKMAWAIHMGIIKYMNKNK